MEVEVKVRIIEEDIERKIEEFGAAFVGFEDHTDTYYNTPYRDFSETDEALRIRCTEAEGSEITSILTYKGAKVDEDSKTRKEVEVRIEDARKMDEILSLLGFSKAGNVIKKRRNYRMDEISIVLDDVEHLGRFIELEMTSEDEDFKLQKEKIFKILKELGFDKTEVIRESYLELLHKVISE